MKKIIALSVIAALLFSACTTIRIKDHDDWRKHFDTYNVEGGFEIYDNNKETAHYYNKEHCSERFSPGSSFEIMLSLIALETGKAPNEGSIIPWDGKKRYLLNDEIVVGEHLSEGLEMINWNKDLNLEQAFQNSALPYFQAMAMKIGESEMKYYLDTAYYGNMEIGEDIAQFWNNGVLKITPDEQVGLIKRIYFNELKGISERSLRILKNMMKQHENDDYTIHYKLGNSIVNGKKQYWVVGFCERINRLKNPETKMIEPIPHPYFFSLHYQAKDQNLSNEAESIRIKLLNSLLAEMHLEPSRYNIQ